MPRRIPRKWVGALSADEKAAIAVRCETFIRDELKPRFLPQIRPTQFNYPVDLLGRWRSDKYSFIQRYRSGFAGNLGEEFNATFARLDHRGDCLDMVRFDAMWPRHNGQYFCLHEKLTLDEALEYIRTDGLLHPL